MKTLFDIPPNRSVRSQDAPRLNRQAWAIYMMLQEGDVTTAEMASVACQYNARVYEIRAMLEGTGTTVKLVQRGANGNNTYGLREVSP